MTNQEQPSSIPLTIDHKQHNATIRVRKDILLLLCVATLPSFAMAYACFQLERKRITVEATAPIATTWNRANATLTAFHNEAPGADNMDIGTVDNDLGNCPILRESITLPPIPNQRTIDGVHLMENFSASYFALGQVGVLAANLLNQADQNQAVHISDDTRRCLESIVAVTPTYTRSLAIWITRYENLLTNPERP